MLLYGYVFGSAMKVPGGGDYKDFLMPGMFVMTMAFGFINTATVVVYDSTKGVIDRFRSMPMASSAVVAGRGVTDLHRRLRRVGDHDAHRGRHGLAAGRRARLPRPPSGCCCGCGSR